MAESNHMTGRRILLGVTGGIAAYKTAELVRQFKRAGAEVRVVMTPDAGRFVTPLTLGTLSENEVHVKIFPENEAGSWTKHVALGLWADLFLVAPLTAQTLSKLVDGACDSMLTAVALTARCPIMVCPAMDHDMYIHPAVRSNLNTLTERGVTVMEAEHGELASGLIGQGRLPAPEAIFEYASALLIRLAKQRGGPLAGKRVVVTAGPTRERIDPVRFISNHSTGTMGFELARAAARRGADVVLVAGPVSLETPEGVRRVDVESTDDMHRAVMSQHDVDIVIMSAAVADFTPAQPSDSKLKKEGADGALELARTTDILADLGSGKRDGQTFVGFALETDNGLENARGKLERKNLDWIVLNNPKEDGAGFGTGTNRVTLLARDGRTVDLPLLPKAEVAEAILELAVLNKALEDLDPLA
ncbi:MAG: bifunctional phosphopantothenoylcysteine decarboxylase/phosphopantothenate--cysteine ligase CoaBC [Rhodothermales bacterium]